MLGKAEGIQFSYKRRIDSNAQCTVAAALQIRFVQTFFLGWKNPHKHQLSSTDIGI
jgi:hypothetical protein